MQKKVAAVVASLFLLAACGQASPGSASPATPEGAPSTASAADDTVTTEILYPEYNSLPELVQAATVVVRGNIVATRVELIKPAPVANKDSKVDPQAGLPPEAQDDTPGSPGTIATLEVTESLQGNLAVGDRIEVTQPGGVYEGVDYQVGGQKLYTVGQPESLFFLEYVKEFNLYTPLNADQSTYVVQPDGGLVPDQPGETGPATSVDEVQEAIESS